MNRCFNLFFYNSRKKQKSDLQRLHEGLKNPEAQALREIVHKLAGRIGQMGAFRLSAKLHDIENEIVEGSAISTLIDEIIEAKDEVEKLMHSIRFSSLQSN